MKVFIYKKKGVALPIAIIIGIIILATSFSLLSLIDNSIRIRKVSEDKISAKYAAEAGVEQGLYQYDLKIKEIKNAKDDKGKKIVDGFSGNGDIKNNSDEILGSYTFSYIPPNTNSKENKGTFDVTGTTSNAKVNIKVEINIDNGAIIDRKEQ